MGNESSSDREQFEFEIRNPKSAILLMPFADWFLASEYFILLRYCPSVNIIRYSQAMTLAASPFQSWSDYYSFSLLWQKPRWWGEGE